MKIRVFVVSGPSGVGKDSLIRKVLDKLDNIYYSVSATTRSIRPGEKNGCDYYFLSSGEFQQKISSGEFLEWKEVFGCMYGTLKSEVEKARRAGKDILLELDVKGALDVKEKIPEAILIFIMPPVLKELEERLRKRGDIKERDLEERLSLAPLEIEVGKADFDYIIVNDSFEIAACELEKVLRRGDEE
ncbi:MAG: guanylate kinase [Actinomycetota bacterium]|nr:guanylate kinase [Actinomycetota bacterium]